MDRISRYWIEICVIKILSMSEDSIEGSRSALSRIVCSDIRPRQTHTQASELHCLISLLCVTLTHEQTTTLEHTEVHSVRVHGVWGLGDSSSFVNQAEAISISLHCTHYWRRHWWLEGVRIAALPAAAAAAAATTTTQCRSVESYYRRTMTFSSSRTR